MAGHLILSDEDVTSEIQGLWRRLNTLQHYKVGGAGAERGGGRRGRAGRGVTDRGQQVPDGATVALVPCLTKHILRESQDYVPGESEYLSPCPPPPITVLCPWFARCPVMGEGPLDLRVGFPST